jgi:hypothetical protein
MLRGGEEDHRACCAREEFVVREFNMVSCLLRTLKNILGRLQIDLLSISGVTKFLVVC